MFLTPSRGPTSRMAACNKCNEPLCYLWKGVRIGVNDAKRLSVCLLDLGAFVTNGSFWVESTALMEVSGEADKKGWWKGSRIRVSTWVQKTEMKRGDNVQKLFNFGWWVCLFFALLSRYVFLFLIYPLTQLCLKHVGRAFLLVKKIPKSQPLNCHFFLKLHCLTSLPRFSIVFFCWNPCSLNFTKSIVNPSLRFYVWSCWGGGQLCVGKN